MREPGGRKVPDVDAEQAVAGVESRVVYHVGATMIGVGQVIRPYVMGPDTLARQALTRAILLGGPEAARHLPDAAWHVNEIDEGFYSGGMIVLEAVFEWVRLHKAPALPGRLGAVFGWRTPLQARRYRTEYCPGGVIHLCKIMSGHAMERDGALVVEAYEAANLANPRTDALHLVQDHALRYWRGQPPFVFPELIVHGTVVVEAHIDPDDTCR